MIKLVSTCFAVFVLWVAASAAAITISAPAGGYSGIVESNGALAWLGIPYAMPTEGALRFRPPQPVPDLGGVFEANAYSPGCLQIDRPEFKMVDTVSESSLTLNIWAPPAQISNFKFQISPPSAGLPVCVFIHGGGFTIGSGSEPLYNGANFAVNGNMIFVTINYRLGAEGFLYLADIDKNYAGSGNLGLLDQITALQWIQRNIAAFGGDPHNVTIMGESAGGASVAFLLTMSEAKGLFSKAIIESGGFQLSKTRADAASATQQFMKAAGCQTVAQLQALSQQQLLEAQAQFMKEFGWLATVMSFAPVAGDKYLALDPLAQLQAGSASGIPVLIGTNQNEMGLFDPYIPFKPLISIGLFRLFVPETALHSLGNINYAAQQFYERSYPQLGGADLVLKLTTDSFFHVNAYRIADAQSAYGNVYMYRFDWPGQYGCVHALELPYVFDNLQCANYNKMLAGNQPLDAAVAQRMQSIWSAFITDGDPANAEHMPLWPAYETKYRPMLQLNTRATLRCDMDERMRIFWYAND